MSPFSLSGKTAVVTGAANGIGREIARIFAAQGADVHLLDLDEENGEGTAGEIQDAGDTAVFHVADVTDQVQIEQLFRDIFHRNNRLNILVNNAGIAHIGTVESTLENDFDRIVSVNMKGVYNCSRAGVDFMKKSGGGVILNMASVAATLGISERFAYSASKGAVLSMTYSMAKDYLEENIRCNAISPARVHTPFVDGYLKQHYPGREKEMFDALSKTQPVGRMGTPEEIASLALYLCSDEAAFITGSNFTIDGGFSTLNT